ncbi:MAG TPA: hypothetical protein VGA20_06520 [Gemmatimonadales bacterium]
MPNHSTRRTWPASTWPVFVVEEDGALVGFCQISAPRDQDVARERAGVLEGNAGARAFYDKLGMRPDGGRKTYPGTTVPEVRYRVALSSVSGGASSARSS